MLSGSKLDHPYETGRLPARVLLKERYYIVKRIAQGGMGAIYLAADTKKPGVRWAIKEMSYAMLDSLTPSKRDTIRANLEESFKREFSILHQSKHPNLPATEEYFEEMGRPYFVMEYIEGKTLEKILEEVKQGTFLPQERVIKWACQICDVLHYLHSKNPPIIYRDLKPSNVMEETKTGNIKLIDFGIARFYKPGKKGDTIRFGTEGYLAPEILSSIDQTNPATDIYSLGALLHEMLTNREPSLTPFVFPPVRSINPAISPEIEKAISWAVEPNPAKRPQSALDLKQELLSALSPQAVPQPIPVGGVPKPEVALQAAQNAPASFPSRTIYLQPNPIHMGTISVNQTLPPVPVTIFAPPGIDLNLNTQDDWVQVVPTTMQTEISPGQVQLTFDSRKLKWTRWHIRPGSPFNRLPGFLKGYLNLHFQVVPMEKVYQSRVTVASKLQGTAEVPVSVVIEPPIILVVLGWLLAFGFILLEVLILCLPIVFLLFYLMSTNYF
jgi:serine/threonine-protein kinase